MKSSRRESISLCQISNGNQRDESWALVCFSYRSPLEGKHLGKILSHSNQQMKSLGTKGEV